MRQFTTLPIDRLVNDVAVDPVHVRELADSIKVSGPISPVMVRQESYELIDGFHRVAAMKELGFDNVECIVTDCDHETFWDLRVMSASLHKAVTFSRAVDWVEECFKLSNLKESYRNAHSLFSTVRQGESSQEAKAWVENKCQKWGLSVQTIENWLYTKRNLEPSLLEEARSSATAEGSLPFSHYRGVAETMPNRPELQKQVIDKARKEGLSGVQTREVARAVAQAPDPEIAQNILRQAVSRNSDELTRSARIEKLVNEPKREPSPRERQRELTGLALDVFLSLEQQIHTIGRLSDETINNLTPAQRNEMRTMLETLAEKIQELQGKLVQPVEGSGRVVEGQLVSGG